MVSLAQKIVNSYSRWMVKPGLKMIADQAVLRRVSGLSALLTFRAGPNAVFREEQLGGIPCMWCSGDMVRDDAAILYLHGGAYVVGGYVSHKSLVARIAGTCGIPAALIDYRLAPEDPFPAAVDDAEAAYRALLDMKKKVIVIGDSAGGGLAFALLQRIQAADLQQPLTIAAISPWVDMRLSSDSAVKFRKSDAMLPIDWINRGREMYLAGTPITHPEVSPVLAQFKSPPPSYLTASSNEMLRDDARLLAEVLKAAGGHVEHEEWPDLVHDWPLYHGKTPEADRTVNAIARFVRRQLGHNPKFLMQGDIG